MIWFTMKTNSKDLKLGDIQYKYYNYITNQMIHFLFSHNKKPNQNIVGNVQAIQEAHIGIFS